MVTRSIALVPTLSVALIAKEVENLTGMNDLLNCVQMIQLPFALLPIITFTSNKAIMHEFRSSRYETAYYEGREVQLLLNLVSFRLSDIFYILFSFIVISINLYFSTDYIMSNLGNEWHVILLMVLACIVYMSFVGYLAIVCLSAGRLVPEGLKKVNSFSGQGSIDVWKGPFGVEQSSLNNKSALKRWKLSNLLSKRPFKSSTFFF